MVTARGKTGENEKRREEKSKQTPHEHMTRECENLDIHIPHSQLITLSLSDNPALWSIIKRITYFHRLQIYERDAFFGTEGFEGQERGGDGGVEMGGWRWDGTGLNVDDEKKDTKRREERRKKEERATATAP